MLNTSPNSGKGKIFVGGLSHDTTDSSLYDYFSKFGEVHNAEVMKDHQTGNSRGFGFVVFEQDIVADFVVRNNHIVDGKNVDCKVAVPKENSFRKVNGENWAASPRYLTDSFRKPSLSSVSSSSFGSYSNDFLRQGAILGYDLDDDGGLLEIENVDDLFPIRDQMPQKHVTRSPYASFANSLPAFSPRPSLFDSAPTTPIVGFNTVPNKIFVGGLGYTTGHESLKRFFEQFGEISSAEVIYNRDTKKSRGFGFVIFQTYAAVNRVLLLQKEKPLKIDEKEIEVKLCKPKEDTSIYDNPRRISYPGRIRTSDPVFDGLDSPLAQLRRSSSAYEPRRRHEHQDLFQAVTRSRSGLLDENYDFLACIPEQEAN